MVIANRKKFVMDPSNQQKLQAQRKKELRTRLRNMQDARKGKGSNLYKEQQKMKEEGEGQQAHMDTRDLETLLKKMGIDFDSLKLEMQKAHQRGQLRTMEDLAQFLSEKTGMNITEQDMMSHMQKPNVTQHFKAPSLAEYEPKETKTESDVEQTNKTLPKKKRTIEAPSYQ